jgi:hypothetical protein
VVEALKLVGHLVETEDGWLALTKLGEESLADEQRYEIYENRQILYFDAYTSYPLPSIHYRLVLFSPGELRDEHHALYSFEPWRPEVLDELARRPDRAKYNVPDEVQRLEPLDVDSAYLPMHIVEAAQAQGGRVVRVFSNIRGRRDEFFTSLLEKRHEILAPLLDDQRPSQEMMGRGLRGMDLPKDSYRLERAPGGEWRAVIPRRWIEGKRPDGVARLADVGEYVLAAGYCVRIWSDDANLRYHAACNKLLDKLQHIHRDLSSDRTRKYIEGAFNNLEVPIAPIGVLLTVARKQGLGQALEHLECMADVTQ